ncbi:DNA-protecting protein DprA [Candidatus Parcubacteria bacterium]|nr:MAG: DNA-protecting protein DprA [Candidatus Parcubacteria bacterium]
MNEKEFCLSFSVAPGVGPKRFLDLISYFGSAEKAWKGSREDFERAGVKGKIYDVFDKFRQSFDSSSYTKKLKEKDVNYVDCLSNFYPQKLKNIPNYPIVLYYRGNVDCLIDDVNKIAVVGTRKMTSYGREVTEKLTEELVLNGFVIVSGLALGVDACAHRTAIENNGKTVAVLGCGADMCFPSENKFLYEKIIGDFGLVVSEYPLGVTPSKGTFPARNRIISALSEAVLVTEAGEDSGSLITAEEARKMGKKVFAVPGPITSELSCGTSTLIKSGAKLVQSGRDILEEFDIVVGFSVKKTDVEKMDLTGEQKAVVKALQNEDLGVDVLAKKTGIAVAALIIIISELEMKGVLRYDGGVLHLI